MYLTNLASNVTGVDAIPILSPISAKSNNQLIGGPSSNTAGGLKLSNDQENAP